MTMLRTLIWFAIAAVAMLGSVWLAARPGAVVVEWRGWRLDTSVGVMLVAVGASGAVGAAQVALASTIVPTSTGGSRFGVIVTSSTIDEA